MQSRQAARRGGGGGIGAVVAARGILTIADVDVKIYSGGSKGAAATEIRKAWREQGRGEGVGICK